MADRKRKPSKTLPAKDATLSLKSHEAALIYFGKASTVDNELLKKLAASARRTAKLMRQFVGTAGRPGRDDRTALPASEAARLDAEDQLIALINGGFSGRIPIDHVFDHIENLAQRARRRRGNPPRTIFWGYLQIEHAAWKQAGGSGLGVYYSEYAEAETRGGDPRGSYTGPFLSKMETKLRELGYDYGSRDGLAQAILSALNR
jgi:hypothetical protein